MIWCTRKPRACKRKPQSNVPEWPLEQIMQCESWFTKLQSITTSRDLLSTYIDYICLQNKYNQNIRRCDVGDDCDVDEADGGVVCF